MPPDRRHGQLGGSGAYRLAVFSCDAGNRVGGGMDRSRHAGDITRRGGHICWVAGMADMVGPGCALCDPLAAGGI